MNAYPGCTLYNIFSVPPDVSAVTWRFPIAGHAVLSAVSSWKWVANRQKASMSVAMWEAIAHASPKPSYVDVPRPEHSSNDGDEKRRPSSVWVAERGKDSLGETYVTSVGCFSFCASFWGGFPTPLGAGGLGYRSNASKPGTRWWQVEGTGGGHSSRLKRLF